MVCSLYLLSLFIKLRCFLDCFFDRANHAESLLWEVIVFAGEDAFKSFDRVFERHVLTRNVSEDLSNRKGLSQELADATRAPNGLTVFVRKLIHTENRDDVFELFIALEYCLYATRHFVVLRSDNQWI